MKPFILFILIALLSLSHLSWNNVEGDDDGKFKRIDKNTFVAEAIERLGEKNPYKPDKSVTGFSIDRGRDLIVKGTSISPRGHRTTRQSKQFTCLSCHNVFREDPNIKDMSNPDVRLEYVRVRGLPFLQGSTFYGIVNRTYFFNGDYELQYSDADAEMHTELRKAMQFCATNFAKGRLLKNWEVESVLAYFWSIQLRMKDLSFDEQDYLDINLAAKNNENQDSMILLIKSRYAASAPATFGKPPLNPKEGFGERGFADSGKAVYDLSCKHCHFNNRYSQLELDDSKASFSFLKRHITGNSRYSIYQSLRKGTNSLLGKPAFMPHYTLQKMSNQQIEDLRAYIVKKSEE